MLRYRRFTRPRLRRRKGDPHLALNALNGTAADATLSSDLQHTLAGPQLILDSLFQGWVYPWPAKLLTRIHGPL